MPSTLLKTLGLACRHLWNIAKPIIIKFFSEFSGGWAGTSIVCVGQFTQSALDLDERFWSNGPLRQTPKSATSTLAFRMSLVVMHSTELIGIVDTSVNRPRVLRKLTTREFVIAHKIALNPEYVHGPFIDALGFGDGIVSRTFCSANDPYVLRCSDPQRGTHCKGVWVGLDTT
ncbi:hypothetical protein PAAG_01562 [Paracoccidioides lutzii Pb01]|uniref:Uncharacterized protein n=1 Tax=Paracoccidioides lutzii (strain ATCC MYA-826 / Pb01) TaxID=502779 RepID=C1GSR7_PARBA|nr:hypothetical protein PAAG_01562 [Paracoccidioides lutzii Pb01]EEH39100.2 hypothetical protein PAAG_01562 [Paracoccidioides lutzii Pb01]